MAVSERKGHLWELEVTSFNVVLAYAKHYFGKLKWGEHEVTVDHYPDKRHVDDFNLHCVIDGYTYSGEYATNRWLDKDELMRCALLSWMHLTDVDTRLDALVHAGRVLYAPKTYAERLKAALLAQEYGDWKSYEALENELFERAPYRTVFGHGAPPGPPRRTAAIRRVGATITVEIEED